MPSAAKDRMVREGKGWMPEWAHAEGERVARLLLEWIRGSGKTVHGVEQAIGWGQKTLYEVVNGEQPIRISHIAAVAKVCDFPVEDFYLAMAGRSVEGHGKGKNQESKKPKSEEQGREIVPGVSDDELFRRFVQFIEKVKKGKRGEKRSKG